MKSLMIGLLAAGAALALPAAAAPGAAQTPVAQANAEVRMDHISIVSKGRGSPVVLIPGLSSPRAVYDGIADDLARRHRVILVQVNGFAGDDPGKNLESPILDGIIADLRAYAARERLGKVAVIGHSMGGLVGLMMARRHPELVGKLLVVDALPFLPVIFNPAATVQTVQPQAAAMRDQYAANYGRPISDAVLQQIAATNALKPESQARVIAWTRVADPRVSGRALYEDMVTDMRGELAAIRVPVTMLYPWSARLPKATAQALYAREYATLPGVNLVDVGDSMHFIMLDQPERFRAEVNAFLGS